MSLLIFLFKLQMPQKTIRDKFNRIHNYLRISLTEYCNLSCAYCMPEEGLHKRPGTEFMTKEEIVQIAEIFVSLGVNKIRLTGGEPLVRKDTKIILTELSALPVELTITTNGILMDQYLDTFKSCGIKTINVSLDTLQKAKFKALNKKDFFDKVLSNIYLLMDNGFHVKVNAVMMKGINDDEIIDFVNWTLDKNIHVRFIEFMPFDGNNWDWSKGVSLNDMLTIIRSKFGDSVFRLNDAKNDTSKNYAISGYRGTYAIISSITNPFCDTCNRIRLTADGKIKNCLFSGNEFDILSSLRNGEDIIPLILEAVLSKKAIRSGINTIEDFKRNENRAMIAIGG